MSAAMKQHALSALFPPLPDDEFAALAQDIEVHGLRNPIVLYEGQILDGWNRYRACLKAHKNPLFTTYGGADPVGYVRAQNWLRRHLTSSQRAAAVVALNDWRTEGRPVTGPNGPVFAAPKSAAEMASEAGVGVTQVKAAKVVHAQGSSALKAAVRDGDMPVRKAAEIAQLPKSEQRQAMREPANQKPKATPTDEYAALKTAYDELNERHRLMADEFSTLIAVQEGQESVTNEMNQLRAILRSAEAQRDQYMRQVDEMRKQIAHWKRQAGKAAA